MTWAGRRRFVVTAIGASLIVFVLALILVPVLYQTPSCFDRTQNQDEEGVDCGGSCSYLCTARVNEPIVRFTKAVFPTENRVDVIAYIDNPNSEAAARDVRYELTLYAADRTTLKMGGGTVDLPPGKSVPIFIPNFFSGAALSGARAFLTINGSQVRWVRSRAAPLVPVVTGPLISGTVSAPRVTATVTNPRISPLSNVRLVAIVYDSQGTVIAASQTLIQSIAENASETATFTWARAFSGTPARIEVVPIADLSSTGL
jgi:hypothetical protein